MERFPRVYIVELFLVRQEGPILYLGARNPIREERMCKGLKREECSTVKADKAKWKLKHAMRRIYITRNQPSPRAEFRHNEGTRAYVLKDRRRGVNWYRY
jgi:hypothetical protein